MSRGLPFDKGFRIRKDMSFRKAIEGDKYTSLYETVDIEKNKLIIVPLKNCPIVKKEDNIDYYDPNKTTTKDMIPIFKHIHNNIIICPWRRFEKGLIQDENKKIYIGYYTQAVYVVYNNRVFSKTQRWIELPVDDLGRPLCKPLKRDKDEYKQLMDKLYN